MVEIDAIDQKILQALQEDGRITNAELARQITLSPPAVYARLRRLEEAGLIQHYTALLNREALGYDLLCLINISMERHRRSDIEAVRKAVQAMSEVLECHHVTGEFDYQLKVVVRNRAELEQFVLDRLSTISGIAHIRTSLVFSEIKSTTRLDVKFSP